MKFGTFICCALLALAATAAAQQPSSREDERAYERGQKALDRSRWDEALSAFTEVASHGGARADGALYWKAYSENKLGRTREALATLEQLRKTHPESRWQNDAKALELEARQSSGQRVQPEAENDEELKLMALNGLMNSNAGQAIPMLEKLLHSSQSPKLKERAMFVLTQSGSPRARQLVLQMAKGGSNPDLQMKAINNLGVMGDRKSLGEVYATAKDTAVKRTVLRALMVAGAREELLNAAKSEKDPDLRNEAINQLGVTGAQSELWQLYQSETSEDVKRRIIRGMFVGGNTDKLLEIAKTEKDPKLRVEAIRNLGISGADRTGNSLVAMYDSNSDPAIRREIIRALFVQGNAHAMVGIARKEKDPELRKEIVRNLSIMGSKEGTDYLMELLNK